MKSIRPAAGPTCSSIAAAVLRNNSRPSAMADSQALKWFVLACNFIVFALSIFGLLRGVYSLILSLILLIYSGVGAWGIWKVRPKPNLECTARPRPWAPAAVSSPRHTHAFAAPRCQLQGQGVLSKSNVGLYGLWTAIYVALAIYLFVVADLTGAGINVVSRRSRQKAAASFRPRATWAGQSYR